MSCLSPDCSYIHNATVLPPALQANPDISGIGVLVGFVGTAYVAFILLVLRYLIGMSQDTNLDESTNPVDQQVLSFIWRKIGKPPARWGEPLKDAVLAMSDTQIVTGLSVLASGFSQVNCGLSIFHWHMVVFLAWFSSVTHLTTLTLLRRYIHDNHGIRTLRLFLMMLLVIALAVALVPTGGACGLQNAGQYNYTLLTNSNSSNWYSTASLEPVFPGSPAKCCFLEMADHAIFVGSDQSYFLSMIASEVVLITSSFTRAIKLFRGTSNFAKTWLRHKPAQTCKRVVRNIEERYNSLNSRAYQNVYFFCHCTIMVLIIFAQAVCDLAESMLWEISWLLFSLAWGTMRIVNIRTLADLDAIAVDDNQADVTLQENYWGFGQLAPTLFLILPLLSLTEGFLVSNKAESTDTISISSAPVSEADTTKDNTTPVVNESPVSHRSSSIEQPSRSVPSNTEPYTEIDEIDNIEMTPRTGTDLVNMEQRIGTNSEDAPGTATRRQSSSSQESPLRSEILPPSRSLARLWPSEQIHKHDFYTDGWYNDLIICIFSLILELGIELIAFTAGAGTKTIDAFVDNFTSWQLYISIILLFCYAAHCMRFGRQPESYPITRRFFSRFSPPRRQIIYTLSRWLFLSGILFMNIPIFF